MQKPSPDRPILKKGHNCWRIAPAKRAAVLINGANYYAQLDKVIRGAQKSILIIGWDFDAGVSFYPSSLTIQSLAVCCAPWSKSGRYWKSASWFGASRFFIRSHTILGGLHHHYVRV